MIRHTAVPSDNPGDNRRLASKQDMPTCGANLPAHCINVRKQLMLHRCKHRCTSLIHGSTFAPLQAAMLAHEGSTNSTNALMCQQWHEDNRRQPMVGVNCQREQRCMLDNNGMATHAHVQQIHLHSCTSGLAKGTACTALTCMWHAATSCATCKLEPARTLASWRMHTHDA